MVKQWHVEIETYSKTGKTEKIVVTFESKEAVARFFLTFKPKRNYQVVRMTATQQPTLF